MVLTGNDELTQSRLEVSTLLAAGDKTHSQLLELMPERSGNAHTRNFETVLKEVCLRNICYLPNSNKLTMKTIVFFWSM
jgi:hypothetical protein